MMDFDDYAAGPGGSPLQAGALPVRRTHEGAEVLLITSLASRFWGIPKGWPRIGEPLRAAAAREAAEEAGAHGVIAPVTHAVFHHEKPPRDGRPGARHIAMFVLHVRKTDDIWADASRRSRRWFTLADAADAVRNGQLAGILGALADTGPGWIPD